MLIRILDIHLRFHSGEKLYQCEICKRSLVTKESLQVHCRTHTGEKPYSCYICNKAFTHMGTLRDHHRNFHDSTPRPHIYEICNADFAIMAHLKLHFRHVHSGDKPHVCEFCNMTFAEENSLARHISIQLEKSLFLATVVQKLFGQNSCLKTICMFILERVHLLALIAI